MVLAVLLLIAVLIYLLVQLRKFFAARKVRKMSAGEKELKLNRALLPFGFCYDWENDMICSDMYPWQRKMGYCRAFDESAFSMYMVFDCEPIYFDYNDGKYLLELWKGQYGCTTGAEIGLYVNRENDKTKEAEELFYECVSDEERLPMTYTLYKNGNKIQERRGIHWWLTGFNVGMHSDKSELIMEVGIGFPNASMCSAFCKGLMRIGYERNEIRIERYNVYFTFHKPRSSQPEICGKWCYKRVMRRNAKNCKLYNEVSKNFNTTLDKMSYIGYCFPFLYRTLIRLGTKASKRKFRKYRKKY
uniref:DUF4474 domain-containing protein n=1 Tax=Acetatifactor sp. TaxID=1872090 RepID=UPI004056D827